MVSKRWRRLRNKIWRNRTAWQRSFSLLVLLPLCVLTVYFLMVCSERYVAEARFAVKGNESTQFDVFSGLAGIPNQGSSSIDSFILQEYFGSRALVEQIEKEIPLEVLFNRERVDAWSRMGYGLSMEDKVMYWRKRVRSSYDPTTTITLLRVTAFRSEDAVILAKAIMRHSERLINQLSEQARNDELAFAQQEVTLAEKRVTQARQAMSAFRNKYRHVDPTQAATAKMALIAELEGQVAAHQAELKASLAFMNAKAPAVQTLRRTIHALRAQIKKEKETVGGTDRVESEKISQIFSNYEPLLVEQTFAERAYASALASLETARVEAVRKHRYLASFVEPMLPQEALEPNRWKSVLTSGLALSLLWGMSMLGVGVIRDHLGWV